MFFPDEIVHLDALAKWIHIPAEDALASAIDDVRRAAPFTPLASRTPKETDDGVPRGVRAQRPGSTT